MDEASQNDIVFNIKVPGATEAAQAMGTFAGSLKNTNEALTKTGDSARKTGDQTQKSGDSARKAAGGYDDLARSGAKSSLIFGAFGQSIAKVSPELETLTTTASRASGAIQNMTFLLGGAAGLATGGLLLAFSLLADKIASARKESEEFAKAQEEDAKAAVEFQKALTAERLALRATSNEWAMNIGKTQAVLRLEKELADAEKNRAAIGPRVAFGGLVNQAAVNADAEISRLKGELAKARANPHYGEHEKRSAPDKSFPNEGIGDFYYSSQTDALLSSDAARTGRAVKFAEGVRDSQTRIDQKAVDLDKEFEIQRAHNKRMVDEAKNSAQNQAQALARIDEQTAKRHQEMREAAISGFSAVGAQGIAALQKLAKGQKVTVKDFLSGMGDEMVAEGTRYLFKGGAELLLGNPGGGAVAAIGAAEIAFGLGLGAATRGGSGPASGGRSTSVGSGQTYWNGSEFVRGQPFSPAGFGGGGGGGPMNVYATIQMPPIPASTADVGMHIDRALEEAKRQGKIRGYSRAA